MPPRKESQSRGSDLASDTPCALLGMAALVAVQNQILTASFVPIEPLDNLAPMFERMWKYSNW